MDLKSQKGPRLTFIQLGWPFDSDAWSDSDKMEWPRQINSDECIRHM